MMLNGILIVSGEKDRGYSFSAEGYKALYDSPEMQGDTEAQLAYLEKLLDGDDFRQYYLARFVKADIEKLLGYEDYLKGIAASAERYGKLSIFKGKDEFAERNIEKTAAAYAALPKNRMYNDDDLDAFDAQVETWIKKFQRENKRLRVPESELNENGLTEDQQNTIDGMYVNDETGVDFGGVYSTGFTRAYNRLLRAITLNLNARKPLPIDETKANQVCQQLDDNYGPFIIARAQFGGALVLTARVDTMRLEGEVTATGKIDGEALGMFKVTGAFSYTENGFNNMRNIGAKFFVMGGDANPTADALANLLASDKPDCREEWFDIMSHWWQSMKADDGGSHAEPISYTVVPIWTLFSEPEITEYVRNWFLNKYRDRGIYDYLDIIEGNPNAKTAEDIQSTQYDFDLDLDATGIPVTGDADHPLTVEQAITVGGKCDAKRLGKSIFYVKGKVCEVGRPYEENEGSATFIITDSGFMTESYIYCKECMYLGQKKWVNTNAQIAAGDEVIVYGMFDGEHSFIPRQCALWSHNGKKASKK